MPYRISDASPLTDADNCKTLFGYDPRSTYNPGAEVVVTIAGTLAYVGYPRVTWTFPALSIELWEDLLELVGDYSGQVYIETRDDIDDWYDWRALARLPEPRTLDRYGGVYKNVEIELLLIEDVTPA